MYSLKPLSKEAIPRALAKAERYRLLNEPHEAESICLDVLAVDAGNQEAVVTLVLALADQLEGGKADTFSRVQELLQGLTDPFQGEYYTGIAWERRAKARLAQGGHGAGPVAHEWLRRAMSHFEAAERLSPPGNEDATLRWNTCARTLMARPELRAAELELAPEPPLE